MLRGFKSLAIMGALSLMWGCAPERAGGGTATEGEGEIEPGDEFDAGPNEGGRDADLPTPVEIRGCPRGQYSDHNGCYSLPSGETTPGCRPEDRRPLIDGLRVDDIDTIAPLQGLPGRRSESIRHLLLSGTVESLDVGRLVVVGDGPESMRVSLNPAADDAEALPITPGDTLTVELTYHVKRITKPHREEVLREDESWLLRLADAEGALIYALGDPFIAGRPVEDNLGLAGFTIRHLDAPVCAYSRPETEVTAVGLCYIYRRNAGYRLDAGGGAAATLLPGGAAIFDSGAYAYQAESGDSYVVEDSDDDCNVPARTDFRILRR